MRTVLSDTLLFYEEMAQEFIVQLIFINGYHLRVCRHRQPTNDKTSTINRPSDLLFVSALILATHFLNIRHSIFHRFTYTKYIYIYTSTWKSQIQRRRLWLKSIWHLIVFVLLFFSVPEKNKQNKIRFEWNIFQKGVRKQLLRGNN